MTPEERDLVSGLFDRLRQFEAQPRDPEVERLIANLLVRQSSTPYLLTQTVLVQEQALKGAQARIAELEAQVAAAPAAPAAAATSAGFLSSAPRIGPWGAAPSSPATRAAAPPPAPQAQPWAATPAAGGGFMRTALMTAAGVAGGALLFEGIRGMMGHSPGPFTAAQPPPLPGDASGGGGQAFLNDSGSADDSNLSGDDSSFDAGFDSGGSDDSNI